MPDTTTIPGAEGGGARSSGPNWIVLAGGGLALIVVLYYIMKMSSGGSSQAQTTAAGTSINAALGSVQEQNLNIMGEVSQAEANLSAELNATNNNVVAGGTQNLVRSDISYYNLLYQLDPHALSVDQWQTLFQDLQSNLTNTPGFQSMPAPSQLPAPTMP